MTWGANSWRIIFAVIVLLAIPTALIHFANGLYAQALEAAAGAVVGGTLLVVDYLNRPVGSQREAALAASVAAREHAREIAEQERASRQARPWSDGVERENWLPRAVLAGFAGSAVMAGILAFVYGLISSFGSTSPEASTFARWSWALTHNTITVEANADLTGAAVGFFLMGIAWALVYARLVQGHLPGHGGRQGMLFSLLPWFLSLIVFLPSLGGGILGFGLGAGPLPLLGNLILHLIYGGTLGSVYAGQSGAILAEAEEERSVLEIGSVRSDEAGTAIGIVVGLIVGAVLGWAADLLLTPGSSGHLSIIVGMLLGSAAGALIGSVTGLTPARM